MAKIAIHLDNGEEYTNLAIAKALIESGLNVRDLHEISQYLDVYVNNHMFDKKGEKK